MSVSGTERRLAAILAADVVGYSKLMGQDEAGTLAALKVLKTEIIEPKVAEHSGRIFKSTGDGCLAEFPSVVNAVTCALVIQQEMRENSLQLRVGINVGDVVVEDGDVFGDGVNVASRVEGIASPGGIALTEMARDHLGSKLKLDFTDTGTHSLKNIEKPIRVFVTGGADRSTRSSETRVTDKPSIAVLPFVNMSGDPEQQYFSDGITEDIITELARFRPLNVIARTASFRFRGDNIDVVRVGRELGVQYILEGSVRKFGPNIRITAQLIDAVTSNHIWAEKFDRAEGEIFVVQDQLVRMIVGTLAGRLDAVRVEKALRKPPSSLAAYDCILRAEALPVASRDSFIEARRWAEKAIELDPTYGRAYAQLAMSYRSEWLRDYSGSNTALDEAVRLANKAIALDENDSTTYALLGRNHTSQHSYDQAEQCFKKAAALNPNRPSPVAFLGILHGYIGRPEEGIACFEQAQNIDRFFEPTWFWTSLGIIYFAASQYEEAIRHLNRSPQKDDWAYCYLAACYALTDRPKEAAYHVSEALRHTPTITSLQFSAKEPFKHPADRDRLLEGLRKAGLPE